MLCIYLAQNEGQLFGSILFFLIGMGFTVALMMIFYGCITLLRQNQQPNFQDFIGNWQVLSTLQGNQTKETDEYIHLEQNDRQLLGYIESLGGLLELKPVGEMQLFTGNIYIIGVNKNTIQIPVSMKLAKNKQEMILVVMTTKLDKNSLPSKFSQILPENFTTENFTLISQRSTDNNKFGMTNQVRQAEAIRKISAMNRAQQAYFLENNRFTSNFLELGVGFKPETENYVYSINLLGDEGVQTLAIPKQKELKNYTGGVFVMNPQSSNQMLPIASICESKKPTHARARPPRLIGMDIQCPQGFQKLNK